MTPKEWRKEAAGLRIVSEGFHAPHETTKILVLEIGAEILDAIVGLKEVSHAVSSGKEEAQEEGQEEEGREGQVVDRWMHEVGDTNCARCAQKWNRHLLGWPRWDASRGCFVRDMTCPKT